MISESAFGLCEDTIKLDLSMKFLRTVDPESIADCETVEQRDAAQQAINEVLVKMQRWHRVAKRTLADRYLAP